MNATSHKHVGTNSTEASAWKLPEPSLSYFLTIDALGKKDIQGHVHRPRVLSKEEGIDEAPSVLCVKRRKASTLQDMEKI